MTRSAARIGYDDLCTECGDNLNGWLMTDVYQHLVDHWAAQVEEVLYPFRQLPVRPVFKESAK